MYSFHSHFTPPTLQRLVHAELPLSSAAADAMKNFLTVCHKEFPALSRACAQCPQAVQIYESILDLLTQHSSQNLPDPRRINWDNVIESLAAIPRLQEISNSITPAIERVVESAREVSARFSKLHLTIRVIGRSDDLEDLKNALVNEIMPSIEDAQSRTAVEYMWSRGTLPEHGMGYLPPAGSPLSPVTDPVERIKNLDYASNEEILNLSRRGIVRVKDVVQGEETLNETTGLELREQQDEHE